MTGQDEALWNRTGRDTLLAAAQTPQTLADYLFGLEGAISVYIGASPTPHTVLAPITFAQEVQFQGGTVVTGAQTITGNLTVGGNLTVVGTETIDQTETLLGLLTVNVASGNIAVFQVGGVTEAHIDATGAYTVGASTTYADGSITTTGTLLATNATLQSMSGTSVLTGGTILSAFATGNPVLLYNPNLTLAHSLVLGDGVGFVNVVAQTSNGSFQVYALPAGKFFFTVGSSGAVSTFNNVLDNGTNGRATFAGLLTMSASASLTGTLSGTYTLGGTPSLGATLSPTADNTWSLGSSALRVASISAVDFLVYASAGDTAQAILLGSVSPGLFGLSLGPGGATSPDTTWVRTAAGIMGGSGLKTVGGATAPVNWSGIGASATATAVSSTQNVVLICTAAGTQSANGAINGVSIGTTFAPGQSFYLKANDTVTWTGTAAPTFVFMVA